MTSHHRPSSENKFLDTHIQLLNESFQRLFGRALLNSAPNLLAEKLFHAPFALLSHNTASNPVFNYANEQGLALFELNWEQLINVPSRTSVEVVNQESRDKLMAQVTTKGFIKNYQGIRISSQGRRFQINNAIIWNIHDKQNVYQGQAAFFSEWVFL